MEVDNKIGQLQQVDGCAGGGWWFQAITFSQPNYSFGCGCCWGCGYCWALTIDLFTAQSLLMNVFGINHFSTTKFNKY